MVDDFISRLEQSSVTVGDIDVKLPFTVRSGRTLQGGFLAPIKKLKRMVPDYYPAPAQLVPGLGLIMLTFYEYDDTDIGPVNEFSVVVPLYSPEFPKVPLYNALKATNAHKMHNFLLHRAANSDILVHLLKDYYHFPDFHASIDFAESDDWLTCEVKEDDNLICRLRGRKIPAQESDVTEVFIYAQEKQKPQYGEIDSDYTRAFKSLDSELTLGLSHPIARELSETLKSIRPRMYTYYPSFQMIIYKPDQHDKPL